MKGIVADVRHEGLREPPRPLLYFPLRTVDEVLPRVFSFVLRGPGAESPIDAVRQTVWALDPDLPVASLRPMDDMVRESIVEFTFTMLTLGIAAVVALPLGAIGLYGVLSYAVTLQTREIGVRIALGAPPSRVKAGVMRNAAAITVIGLVIGTLGARVADAVPCGTALRNGTARCPNLRRHVRAAVCDRAVRVVSASAQGRIREPVGGYARRVAV